MVIQKRDLYRSDKSNYDILADRSEGATKKRATRGDTEDSVCLYTFLPVPGPKRTKLKSGSPATWTLTGRETCFFNTKFWFWASVFKMFCHSFDTRDVCLSCSHFMHLYLILSLRTLLVKALFYIAAVFLFGLYLSTHDMSVHFKCFQSEVCLPVFTFQLSIRRWETVWHASNFLSFILSLLSLSSFRCHYLHQPMSSLLNYFMSVCVCMCTVS